MPILDFMAAVVGTFEIVGGSSGGAFLQRMLPVIHDQFWSTIEGLLLVHEQHGGAVDSDT